MSIIRATVPPAEVYKLDKDISEDARLSWAARGLLIYLLVQGPDYRLSIPDLVEQTKSARISAGRVAIYTLLRELRRSGHLRLVKEPAARGHGRYRYEFAGVPA